ncbi:hypothetical protein PUN28_000685 [Cardiocondyla obscurior]|uniref:Uncharacterized protein n=1 Tax=Cardiocondyla obscurior TaxID=286306 RepID=A0AAW2H0L2_9HYME
MHPCTPCTMKTSRERERERERERKREKELGHLSLQAQTRASFRPAVCDRRRRGTANYSTPLVEAT